MDNFNIEKEIWKDIPDFEGLYQVSDKGRVRSLDRKVWNGGKGVFYSLKGKVIKQFNNRGYRYVPLSKNGKPTNVSVHRLVAEAFLPNSEKLTHVNHKDENKKNNRLENLEWCTPKYNTYYGKKTRIKPVVATNVLTGEQTTYPSIMEASRLGGFYPSAICNACKGKLKTHGKHYWQYLEEV